MTPSSRRSARKEAANSVTFKFVATNNGIVNSLQLPYVAEEEGGACVKGLAPSVLKTIKSYLNLPSTGTVVMMAKWLGDEYEIFPAVRLDGFMNVLRNAKVRA